MLEAKITNPFPIETCRKAMRAAIVSSCFGAISQNVVRDSSIIILYATLLNASRFVALCTTSLESISMCALIIPTAYIMQNIGIKKLIMPAITVSLVAFLVVAAAPWFGAYSHIALLGGLSVFSIMIAVYAAGWFPLLKDIVPEHEKGRFFGRIRVSWQAVTILFFIISSIVVGKYASVGTLQLLILIAGLGILGRLYYVYHIPEKPPKETNHSFLECISDIIANSKLIGFSVYLFWLYLFAGATVPVIIVFAKLDLKIADNIIVFLSFSMMTGSILGYFTGGNFVDKYGTKRLFLSTHFGLGILNFLMFFIHAGSLFSTIFLFVIVALYGVIFAAATVAVSSEMFALVPEHNKAISMAVCVGLYNAGLGISRFFAGWILDSGMLSESWTFMNIKFSQYHTLFLAYGIGVIVSCILLTLVPAVTIKAKRLPHF